MPPQLMKAALCKEFGKPIVVEQVPVPVPQGRELLVRVQAVSLCHTDLSIAAGALGPVPLPLIVGHEAVSVVEALGPEAAPYGLKVGDRIGAPLWHAMCLQCNDCRHNGPEFCPLMQVKGLTAPGYFSEYTCVDPASAVLIPEIDGGSFASLAPVFCAGITVWDALKRAKLQMNETVAVVGAGGLGEIAARYAQAMGVKVIVLDVQDPQLQAAKENGSADEVLNTSSVPATELPGRVAALNNGKLVDVVVVTTGALPAYQTSLNIVRTEGRIVAVGIPKSELSFMLHTFTGRGLSLIGAKVAGKAAAQECLEFSLRKNILPKVHPRKFELEDINEMMELMQAGKVQDGRMIVQFF
ncbi:hypothetical protein BDW75DRAFT_245788 [Aspergillus navahoensis]